MGDSRGGADGAAPNDIVRILLDAAEQDVDLVKAILENINSALKDDLRTGSSPLSFRAAAVARRLYYFALALDEAERAGSTRALKPSWIELRERYLAMSRTLEKIGISTGLEADDFSKFCLFSTRRRGSQKTLFYASMAIFAATVLENGSDDEAATEFMKVAIPDSERKIPRTICQYVVRSVKDRRMPTEYKVTHDYPIARVGYTYQVGLMDEFRQYFKQFAFGEDGSAHFICYRPQHNDPTRLVKTFLAIIPPERRRADDLGPKNSFGFVHIYQVPSLGDLRRISIGEVLALEKGICLIGGQRVMHRSKLKTEPFTSLKIITVPWSPVESHERILPGLVMSASYKGEHLVSRLAMRATSFDKSEKIPSLDSVGLEDLASDIAKDVEAERKAIDPAAFAQFEVDPETCAKRIISLTDNNNLPNSAESQAFMSEAVAGARPHHLDGKSFSFWENLRYGPLSCE